MLFMCIPYILCKHSYVMQKFEVCHMHSRLRDLFLNFRSIYASFLLCMLWVSIIIVVSLENI